MDASPPPVETGLAPSPAAEKFRGKIEGSYQGIALAMAEVSKSSNASEAEHQQSTPKDGPVQSLGRATPQAFK